MASSKEFVQYVCDQMSAAAPVTYKSMFGEYGLFAEGKFFAVICDSRPCRLFAAGISALRRGQALSSPREPGGGRLGFSYCPRYAGCAALPTQKSKKERRLMPSFSLHIFCHQIPFYS